MKFTLLLGLCLLLVGVSGKQLKVERDTGTVMNPEKGFMQWAEVPNPVYDEAHIKWIYESGHRITFLFISLAEYYDGGDITKKDLSSISEMFSFIRKYNMKAVIRVAYDWNSTIGADPPLVTISGHMQQLKPIFQEHEDILMHVHVGLLGKGGSWFGTNETAGPLNFGDTLENLKFVVNLVYESIPATSYAQINFLWLKPSIFPDFGADNGNTFALNKANGFEKTRFARTGGYNSCFLSDNFTDLGHYREEYLEQDIQFEATDSTFTPLGGNFCSKNLTTFDPTCDQIIDGLKKFHFGYFLSSNGEYECEEEMAPYLGYELTLTKFEIDDILYAGKNATLVLEFENIGSSRIYFERPVFLVLNYETWTEKHFIPLEGIDLTRILSGETAEFSYNFIVPNIFASVNAGIRVGLWLPDAEVSLRNETDYSLRLYNKDMWELWSGINYLTDTIGVFPRPVEIQTGVVEVTQTETAVVTRIVGGGTTVGSDSETAVETYLASETVLVDVDTGTNVETAVETRLDTDVILTRTDAVTFVETRTAVGDVVTETAIVSDAYTQLFTETALLPFDTSVLPQTTEQQTTESSKSSDTTVEETGNTKQTLPKTEPSQTGVTETGATGITTNNTTSMMETNTTVVSSTTTEQQGNTTVATTGTNTSDEESDSKEDSRSEDLDEAGAPVLFVAITVPCVWLANLRIFL